MDLFTNQPHKTQLIITALAASLATASLFHAYNTHTKRVRRRKLDQEIRLSIAKHGTLAHNVPKPPSRATTLNGVGPSLPTSTGIGDAADYDEDLIREQLARNYAFFGEKGMERIREGRVVVVGCGGVGSWAAVMLVRSYVSFFLCVLFQVYNVEFLCSGVSKIRLVDFDYVTLSSLNRHATAGLDDVGTPKVKCVEKTLLSISKWVQVDSRVEIWRKEEGGALLEDADWVIGMFSRPQYAFCISRRFLDAIDNIQTKVDLLKYCHDNDIRVDLIFMPQLFTDAGQGFLFHGRGSQMRPNPNTNQRYLAYDLRPPRTLRTQTSSYTGRLLRYSRRIFYRSTRGRKASPAPRRRV